MTLPLLLLATAGALLQPQRPDSAVLVTRLGNDTLAIERIVRAGARVEADVVLRAPATTRTRYVATLTPGGGILALTAEQLPLRPGVAAGRREQLLRRGDSVYSEVVNAGRTQARTIAAGGEVLPFIDMVHWPLDLAFQRMVRIGVRAGDQLLVTGARVTPFPVALLGGDSATLTHPSRGVMRARLSPRGELAWLDAGATTRKLVVERRPWMEVDSLAARWAAADAAGRGIGALSGRGRVEASVQGAAITVDYGTPLKRGREIWGALVPYDRIWRTGANEATHLTTDRDLVLGAGGDTLVVPAGRYTIFSIPGAAGAVLVVNRQTGQNGMNHDPSLDLGRVAMQLRELPAPVEAFTIAVRETPAAALHLQWDRREYVVPLRVRPAP